MSPYFSVILSIYNVAPYLNRCVRSVLTQSFRDFELILVDDGSTDASSPLCDELAAADSRIRVLHKPNGGLSSARNAGLEAAQGRYIWWVDADDWIEPEALAVLYRESCQTCPDIMKFDHFRAMEKREIFRNCMPAGRYDREKNMQLMDQAFLAGSSFCLSAWSHVYRHCFLKEKGLSFISERQVGSEDYRFNLEALLLAGEVLVMDKPLYNYELRPGSLSKRYRQNLFERYTRLYRQLAERYEEMRLPAEYFAKLKTFYIFHLFLGTCVLNEYHASDAIQSPRQARAKIRSYLHNAELRQAAKGCDTTYLSWKKKIRLLAVALQTEPLLYWIYVGLPRMRRQSQHEVLTEAP